MTINQKIVEAIRDEFPKHNKAAYSMAGRPGEYGVQLVPRAREIERAIRGGEKNKDHHRKQFSFRVRVTEQRYREVKELLEAEGRFPTVNAWLDWWIWVWLKNKKETASGGTEAASAGDRYDEVSVPPIITD